MESTSVYYSLTNNIDCNGTLFETIGGSSQSFRGTLDGKGFSVSNLSISTNHDFTGLFATGNGAKVKNITFLNFNIQTNGSYVGLIFGSDVGSLIENVIFDTSNPSDYANLINSTKIGQGNIGGFVGAFSSGSSKIYNSIIKNTFINAPNSNQVGSFFGYAIDGTFINLHNLGFSDPSKAMVFASSVVGGIGGVGSGSTFSNCGVRNGRIVATASSSIVGGFLGNSIENTVSQCYVKQSVNVSGSEAVGGFSGFVSAFSSPSSFSNIYSRAAVSGTISVGGLMGQLLGSKFLNISYSYCSNIALSGITYFGVIGSVSNTNCSIEKVYFNNETISQGIGNGNCINSTAPISFGCGELYASVVSNFGSSIWSGDNLQIEMPQMYGYCNCSSGGCPPSTAPPSTLPPTTNTPSTLTPSTLMPSTSVPSTLTPSTITPSTLIPSTITPSTINPSTMIPSTLTPSTNIPSITPSTITPSTINPSTLIPSTLTPSTNILSTNIPSTFIPETTVQPTFSPQCLYKVPDCEKCGDGIGLKVNTSQVDVSCIESNSGWIYSFSNRFSNVTVINESFTLNSTSMVVVGNMDQSPNSTIQIVFSESNKNGAMNVTGCITLNGNISLILEKRPQRGETNIILIVYNCSQPINFRVQTIQASQFSVKPTYVNNKCDKLSSTLNNQQNTLSVSLSTTYGSNCKGISTGAIIGIVLGVVGGTLVIIIIAAIIIWKRDKNFDKQMTTNIDMDEKPNKNKWNKNEGHEQNTKWKEFNN